MLASVLGNRLKHTYSLGNYEKQVLLELDQELTAIECHYLNMFWPRVRITIHECYDLMLEPSACKREIKYLLRHDKVDVA